MPAFSCLEERDEAVRMEQAPRNPAKHIDYAELRKRFIERFSETLAYLAK
jgi:hypothetical protein